MNLPEKPFKIFVTQFSRNIWWQIGLILILTVAAYSNIFHNGFVGDDLDFIVNWELIRQWRAIPELLKGAVPYGNEGVFRPIRGLAYLIMYQFFGANPLPYHFFSLAVHLASTGLVYLITRKITKKWWVALATGLLFGLHPVHTESITWITGSFDALGFMFMLAAFYLYLIQRGEALISAGLAFFAEELTLTLPLLLTLYHWCFGGRKNTRPFWLLALMYALVRLWALGMVSRGSYLAGSFWLTMLASIKAYLMYFKLLLYPVPLTLDHTIPPGIFTFSPVVLNDLAAKAQSVKEPFFLVSLAVMGLLIFAVLKLKKIYPVIAFGIGWFLLSLLPVSNLIPIYSPFREMYAYIASFGVILAIVAGLAALIRRKEILLLLLIPVALGYGITTFGRNKAWNNEIGLWQETEKYSKNNPMVYYKLGSAYQMENRFEEALLAYDKALDLNPELSFVVFNIGSVYEALGNCDKGVVYFNQAVSLYPESQVYTDRLAGFAGKCARKGL